MKVWVLEVYRRKKWSQVYGAFYHTKREGNPILKQSRIENKLEKYRLAKYIPAELQ